MKDSTFNRRTFLRSTMVAAAAVPMGIPLVTYAEPVSEDDPSASALGYRHDTTTVDSAKFPQHKPEQQCDNCQLFLNPDEEGWGACAIFPNKQVAAKGWCSAWVKKVG